MVSETRLFQDWLDNHIQPTSEQREERSTFVNRVANVARESNDMSGHVDDVFWGGSFRRRTDTQLSTEAKIVLLLNPRFIWKLHEEVNEQIARRMMNAFPDAIVSKAELSVTILADSVSVEILPAYAADNPREVAQLVLGDNQLFRPNAEVFRLEHLNEMHPSARDRIRIAKFWLERQDLTPREKPPTYAFELMVLWHCAQTNGFEQSYPRWFSAFLKWLGTAKFRTKIDFTNSVSEQGIAPRGVWILDPGNPSENVAKNWTEQSRFLRPAQMSYMSGNWEHAFGL